ncbi:hypothetical protein MVEN_01772600 [Mycena venus]|uniref:Zn(2)-C6 fungal-type domain-containing protein n=1 Tax=Mycena venus TaxID=2733690 RepID=A0A8H6XN12_9AGAR|nr:hypothetical protein MVEN_01772600 [Mycena venus]
MKRAISSNENPPPKRTKASQACASCRRQKSRCEILEVRPVPGVPVIIRCHRCKTLNVECSFETSELIHFSPKTYISPVASSPTVSTPTTSDNDGGLSTLAAVASSRPNVEEAPVNHISGSFGMRPEDLVPTAATPIWGSISRVDWTATPMLAIQELLRCPRTDTGLQIPSTDRLSDILSPPEITSLVEIFETRYAPWLCAQPGPPEGSNSLLDIVRCTIASRHLLPTARSTIAPRLQKLTEDVFLREIFNPQPPLESITALLILSVWTPICGTGAEARDGRLLIASAVSMAMNLHLQSESKRATGLRADKAGLCAPDKQAELIDSIQRWRLWMHLSIFESMLCLGTGRMPVSHFSAQDHEMINLSALADFTVSAVRDIRLGLSAKLFDISESALTIRLKSVDDMGAFFDKMNASIQSLEGLSRLITPMPSITHFDIFYSQMLILQYHGCRLLMVHHALRETRTAYERDRPQTPWYVAEMNGQGIALFWGYPALISAETVLSTFLGTSDLNLLSTAPDNLYAIVGFAATWLFVSNFSLHQLGKGHLGGASERLQSMTIDRLNKIALAPDHTAARCGHVLGALMNAWEQRKPLSQHRDGTIPANMCGMRDVPLSPYPNPNPQGDEYLNPPSYQDLASGAVNNPDLFMDDAFWASFIENLNSDTLATGAPDSAMA